MEETAPVLALVRDLMFSSKISATGKALNLPVKIVRDPAKLSELTGRRLLVDLGQEGALEAAAKWVAGRRGGDTPFSGGHDAAEHPGSRAGKDAGKDRSASGAEAIGFVSHVDAVTIARAEAAGIMAMPRSRFVQVLPELLGTEPIRR